LNSGALFVGLGPAEAKRTIGLRANETGPAIKRRFAGFHQREIGRAQFDSTAPTRGDRVEASARRHRRLKLSIDVTLRQIHNVLSQTQRGTITGAEALSKIRGYLSRPAVQDAVHKSNDTIAAFALRAANQILSDLWAPSLVTINRLLECVGDPELNRALGNTLKTQSGFWIKKPPA
jgi:hypothetical protein